MAEVIDFAAAAGKRKKPSITEIVGYCTDEILQDWARFATNNKLNEYFTSCIPTYCRFDVNYLDDLTSLSYIEAKAKIDVQVISPGFQTENVLGWIAATRVRGEVVATPPMVNENYARCFNILLYLKVKREVNKHGL